MLVAAGVATSPAEAVRWCLARIRELLAYQQCRPACVTQKELARQLGLSQATVSRALSGAAGVRSEVRQRVLAAARELDYRTDPLAGALRRRRTIGRTSDSEQLRAQ